MKEVNVGGIETFLFLGKRKLAFFTRLASLVNRFCGEKLLVEHLFKIPVLVLTKVFKPPGVISVPYTSSKKFSGEMSSLTFLLRGESHSFTESII